MGSHAALMTSHSRKSSTPTAAALSRTRNPVAGRRSRPMGSPIRMVAPASNPRRSVRDNVMGYALPAVRT